MELHLTLNDYARSFKQADQRRSVYYIPGGKKPIPKKYQTVEYGWIKLKGRKFWGHLASKERCVSNPKTAGTPRITPINGQDIYNGRLQEHARNKLMQFLKNYFLDKLNSLHSIPIFSHPVSIKYSVMGPRGDVKWDLDNHMMPYIKAFQDALVDKGILAGDGIEFIKSYCVTFYYGDIHKMLITVTDEA